MAQSIKGTKISLQKLTLENQRYINHLMEIRNDCHKDVGQTQEDDA